MNEQQTFNHGWQPMDTAPKDRRILLISRSNGETYVGHWVKNFNTDYEAYLIAFIPGELNQLLLNDPLCWHELPELPELPVSTTDGEKEVID